MRKIQYVSIDTETLGIDPETCDIIEFGAVLETVYVRKDGQMFAAPYDKLPTFQTYLTKHGVYQGEPYAMWMNAAHLKRIAEREKDYTYMPGDLLDDCFNEWQHPLTGGGKVMIAGKNFDAFDNLFLKKLGFGSKFRMQRRRLDPGSLFFDPAIDDEIPSLSVCLERANIKKEVTHDAIGDSLDVIRCIRHAWSVTTE